MLPRSHRLPSQDIGDILRLGVRVRAENIDLIYKKTQYSLRFACIVSAKVDKRATARNRMKRLVREAVQHMLHVMKDPIDGVFIVRHRLPDSKIEVENIVRDMLAKI